MQVALLRMVGWRSLCGLACNLYSALLTGCAHAAGDLVVSVEERDDSDEAAASNGAPAAGKEKEVAAA